MKKLRSLYLDVLQVFSLSGNHSIWFRQIYLLGECFYHFFFLFLFCFFLCASASVMLKESLFKKLIWEKYHAKKGEENLENLNIWKQKKKKIAMLQNQYKHVVKIWCSFSRHVFLSMLVGVSFTAMSYHVLSDTRLWVYYILMTFLTFLKQFWNAS